MSPDSMRVAVAKAMGWHKVERTGFRKKLWRNPENRLKKGGGACYEPPDYLNDLNAAFQFVEFLRGKGFEFQCKSSGAGWNVGFFSPTATVDPQFVMGAASLPHAICEAGLKSLGLYDGTEGGR